MPLSPWRQLPRRGRKGGYGVGAFNVNDMEQIQPSWLRQGNQVARHLRPAAAARQFARILYLFKLIQAAAELNPDIPIACTRITATSFETCQSAIALGTPPS